MKKFYFLLGVLPILYSCSEFEELPDVRPLSSDVTTRFVGDEKYDVLGFGYDATGEYLHPMSVRNPVLDIEKYEEDHKGRLVMVRHHLALIECITVFPVLTTLKILQQKLMPLVQ